MLDQVFISPFWQTEVFQNTLESYIISGGLFVSLVLFFWVFHKIVLIRVEDVSKKTVTDIDNQFVKIIRSIKPTLYVSIAFLISLDMLLLGDLIDLVIKIALWLLVTYQVITSLYILVDYVARKIQDRRESLAEKEAIETIGKIVKGVLWVIGALVILQNLGIQVTSLIAGLGIGGIAIAFALQNILGDLFSSFAIIFDKPFEPGDFIVVGEHSGVVQEIGIKTTRIKALQGEEIVISNTELTNARIQNFKKLSERRVAFMVGVAYETDTKKLKKIPGMVEKIISPLDQVRFDRAHLHQFGDSSLNFEIVYFIDSSDYAFYMDTHQSILLAIKDGFDTQKIEIAYPTQTLYLRK